MGERAALEIDRDSLRNDDLAGLVAGAHPYMRGPRPGGVVNIWGRRWVPSASSRTHEIAMLAPITLRRLVRRKRGHFIKCGYDLSHAEHNVSPECGVQV